MKKVLFLLLLGGIILLFNSCDDNQNFALDLLPQEDFINTAYTDTLTIELKTSPYSHVRTSNSGSFLFGSYYDPIFGYTKASAVFQVQQFAYPKFNDSTDYTIDSVFLYLTLDMTYTPYGKPYNSMPLYLYEVSDTLNYYQNYYADENLEDFTNYNLLGYTEFSIFDLQNDSALKIEIDPQLARRFIDSVDYYFYNDEGRFTDRFKGFILTTGDNFYDAAIYRATTETNTLDPNYTNSFLVIYYHPDTLPDTSLSYKLIVSNLYSVNFTVIEHDYSNTSVFDNNTDSVVYLQTAGTKIDLTIPYLTELKDIVIHKAELELTLEDPIYTSETSFPPPDKIYLLGFSEYDTAATTPVYLSSYYNTMTGQYNGFDRSLNKYTINMTHLVQQIINGEFQDTINLSFVDLFKDQKMTRAVINTANNSQPAKLVVFYTKINN